MASNAFAQTDSLATKSFEKLTTSYRTAMESSNLEDALLYSKAAYVLAEKEQNTTNIIYSLYRLADTKSYLSKNESALQDVEKALALANNTNDNNVFYDLYNLKGIIKTDMGEYSEALTAYIKSKEYAELGSNELNKMGASINIGFIKKLNQDYEEAISIFKENLEVVKQMDIDSSRKARNQRFLYVNLTDTYLRMKELVGTKDYIEAAEYYNNLGLEIAPKKQNANQYDNFLINKVIIEFEKKKYDESIKLASNIKAHAIEIKDTVTLGTMYFYIGKNYHAQDKHAKAIENFEKFYTIIQKSEKEYSNEYQLHGLMAWSYSEIGVKEKFNFHRREHNRLQNVQKKQNLKIISQIHTRYDLPELKKKLKEIAAKYKQQEVRKKWLYGISIFLVLVLIGSFFFYRLKVKRIQERVEAVLQKVIELENEKEKQAETQGKNKTIATSSISEKVTDEKAVLLLEQLAAFEAREEYLSLDCSLAFVAEKVSSNTSYVSNVINNYKNKTFKAYITELRINAALIRLKSDEKLRSYTIKAVAEEFGFKRQETFSKAFKAQTGIYPSRYIKKLKEDLEIN
ncbi:helix-turn-helix domain-containing protein [Kordia sp.]|uniref:helix-turn-helix domain-containing protein n=1 Tax=Kordia sp. TaxID=1965332 RepID=UPI003B5AF4BC